MSTFTLAISCLTTSQFALIHGPPVLLLRKSHGRRSLVSYSPRGRWGLDKTERLHIHFSLSCIGGGNGNPLQCSCLENPRDRGAGWAAIYGDTQSWTWLKWHSSSSNSSSMDLTFQVPIHYSSLQHQTLLLSPITSTTGYCFALAPSLHSFWHYFSTDLQ